MLISHVVHRLAFTCSLGALAKGGSRAVATSKMECFVITLNGWKPLTIIKKPLILDVAAALDPPLLAISKQCL